MGNNCFPDKIPNWIQGSQKFAKTGKLFEKLNPHNGKRLCGVARSGLDDVDEAVRSAAQAQDVWSNVPPVKRGEILHNMVRNMQDSKKDIAEIVALETGKSFADAFGETGGAIELGLFYSSEGQRLYGKTTTSGLRNKYAMTVRQPVGIAGLVTAANTPIANVAWKVFPALICGNSVILKPAEDTPVTAWIFGRIANESGLPEGVLNIVQGYGNEAGEALVANPNVGVISFTGSSQTGRIVQRVAGERLAKISLELGGKNPLVVCDDADLENACKWSILSAFSNAGQRCVAASRIIVFESIYRRFREMLVEKTKTLSLGNTDDDDFGPVINLKQLNNILKHVNTAVKNGAVLLTGGNRLEDDEHRNGYYMEPTIIENVDPSDEISVTELFGPVTCLYRAEKFSEALALSNNTPYGLSACIHTTNIHRAIEFTQKVQAGVAVVNAGTYGSEPHMPFGGYKQSGNGSREPGTEALDIYSELKNIYMVVDTDQL